MIESEMYKSWLENNTSYSKKVVYDMSSRMKRADSIEPWEPTKNYLYKLEQTDSFERLSPSVKSQIRRAVKHYAQFVFDNSCGIWGNK